jgi:tetratricopeptide (TPR) repeat protein
MALQTEARRLAAPGLLAKGETLAKSGEVNGAIGAFKQARALDPTLTLHPATETWRLAVPALVAKGAKQGDIREAIAAFTTAQESDPHLQIDAEAWNALCWSGSLWDFAPDVLAACERAVALAPEDGNSRDSRGVARALTGDYPGAIEDFQRFLEWGAKNHAPEEQIQQRRDWLRMLQAQQNPINAQLLQRLRKK